MSGNYEYGGQAQGMAPPVAPTMDTLVYPGLETLAACLCEELATSLGGVPCFCGVVPGRIVPMDFCDCATTGCGMAWVRLDAMFPSRAFPTQTTDARCNDPLASRIELGVTRCLPGMDAQGNPPGVVEQSNAVAVQMADAMAMRRAIACCYGPNSKDYVLGTYQPVGPQGSCGGGTWTFTLRTW